MKATAGVLCAMPNNKQFRITASLINRTLLTSISSVTTTPDFYKNLVLEKLVMKNVRVLFNK